MRYQLIPIPEFYPFALSYLRFMDIKPYTPLSYYPNVLLCKKCFKRMQLSMDMLPKTYVESLEDRNKCCFKFNCHERAAYKVIDILELTW